MSHGRAVLSPGLSNVLRPLAVVAIVVAFLTVLSLGRAGGAVGPADVLVPVAVVAFFGCLEFGWFMARTPKSIVLDEEGILVQPRRGEAVRFPWSDLADRDARAFAPGWVLVRKDGSRRTLSLFGFSAAQRATADRRIVDVLLHGPPLAREERDWAKGAPQETTGTLLAGLGGATLGAMLGAAGWGLLAWLTGLEIGYAAIGVGALVGLAARTAGGRGPALGAGCAVLVLASILTGKVLAVRLYVGDYVRKEQAKFDRPMYDRIGRAAAEIAGGAPDHRHAAMLVELGWSGAGYPAGVTDEELRQFREVGIPNLRDWNRLTPRFEAWQEERREGVREDILANVSYARAMTSSVGIFDILFAVIGISAALRFSGEKKKPGRDGGMQGAGAPVAFGTGLGPEAPRKVGSLVGGKKVVFPPKKGKGPGAAPEPPPEPPPTPPPSAPPPPAAPPPPGTDPPAPRS